MANDDKVASIFGIATILFWASFVIYLPSAGVLVVCGIGIFSGVLMLAKRRLGAILAISVSSIMLLSKLWSLMRGHPDIFERLYALLFVFLPKRPLLVIHADIIATIFGILTIAFLTKRSVWQKLN